MSGITVGRNPLSENIQGTSFNDIIDAGGGRDVVRGGAGNDFIRGGANRDRLFGGDGEDVIWGDGSNDNMSGEGGGDILYGGGGIDRIFGGSGTDHIIGGEDNDVLHGGNPNERYTPPGEADFFYFGANDGADRIMDFEQGIDKIVLEVGTVFTIAGNVLSFGATSVQVFGATQIALNAGDISFGPSPSVSFPDIYP